MRKTIHNLSGCKVILFLFLSLLSFQTFCFAADTTLRWDKNIEINLAGYKLYYKADSSGTPYNGTGSDQGPSPIDIPLDRLNDPDNPEFTITGIDAAHVCFFVLTAYDTDGNESGYSNEVFTNQTPSADAGPDQTVNTFDLVTLNGSNSIDLDDGISSLVWSQTSGPSVVLDSPTSTVTTFRAPDVASAGASLTFEVTVVDFAGAESKDSCIINIISANAPPVAHSGDDQTVREGSLVTLNGGNSNDSEGPISLYQWTQISGAPVTLADPSAVVTSFTSPDVGSEGTSLTFQLTVVDQGGLESQDTCNINVTWENIPPVADAGVDMNVDVGSTVILDGSKSVDADDGIAAYQWAQISGIPVEIIDPTSAQTSFAAPQIDNSQARLEFQLTITDRGGLKADDTCVIIVSGVEKEYEISAIANQNGTITPSGRTLVISGSNQTYTITPNPNYHMVDVLVDGSSVGSVESHTFTNITGNHTIEAVFGMDTHTIQASAGPNGQITPSGNLAKDHGSSQLFTMVPSANYHVVDVLVNRISVGSVTSYVINNISTDYTIQAFFEADVIYQPPSAHAGQDQFVKEDETVFLDGSKSFGSNGNDIRFQWTQVSGPPVTLYDTMTARPSFTAPVIDQEKATVIIRLTVTDSTGLKSSDECSVEISKNVNDEQIKIIGTKYKAYRHLFFVKATTNASAENTTLTATIIFSDGTKQSRDMRYKWSGNNFVVFRGVYTLPASIVVTSNTGGYAEKTM